RKAGRLRLALALFGRFLRDAPAGQLRVEAEAHRRDTAAQIEALYEGAEAAERAGRAAEAISGYERYLREAPPGELREGAARRAGARGRRAALGLGQEAERGAASRRHLRAAKWTLGGVGLAAAAVGAILIGVDGLQTCAKAPHCELELDSRVPGAVLLA